MYIWKEPKYSIVTERAQLEELCSYIDKSIKENKIVSIDVETTGPYKELGLNCYYGWLLGVSICVDIHEGWYIPLNHTKDGVRISNQITVEELRECLGPVVENQGSYLGHNMKFDYKFLWQSGIKLFPQLWCTAIAQRMLNGGDKTKSAKLKDIIPMYVSIPKHKIQTFEEISDGDAAEQDWNIVGVYAINDVIFTLYTYMSIKPIVEEQFGNLFYNAEMAVLPVLAQTELRGVRVDIPYMKTLAAPMGGYIEKIKSQVEKDYGIMISSPAQIAEVLETFKGFRFERTKTGQIVTDAKVLPKIADKAKNGVNPKLYKFVNRVLSYRGLTKAKDTYIEKFPNICDIHYIDNQIINIVHTNFNQVVDSGRMSSAPNFQNIPKKEKSGVDIRKGFIPRPGYEFTDADWKSEELRIVAVVSDEPKMLQAYKDDPINADLHTLSAQGIFGVEKPTDVQRFVAKTFNFALLYGATEYSISRTLGCSEAEAAEYIRKYNETYQRLHEWKLEIEEKISKDGYVETLFGRRRYCGGGVHKGMDAWWIWDKTVRALINTIIQGTGADILKFAMAKLTKDFAINNVDAFINTSTHDSITVENRVGVDVTNYMKDAMEIKIKGVLLPIDIERRTSWSK